jgi:hypothetical protein
MSREQARQRFADIPGSADHGDIPPTRLPTPRDRVQVASRTKARAARDAALPSTLLFFFGLRLLFSTDH